MIVGIYRIISPTGRIYVGQSTNIEARFKAHRKISSRCQPKLNASLRKYGVKNHIFEIIMECSIDELNEKERYYRDLYNCTSHDHLNCRLTTSSTASGKLSESHKKAIGEANRKRIYKESTRKKASDLMKKRVGALNGFFGKKHSQQTKELMRIRGVQRIYPTGIKYSAERNLANSLSHKGIGLLGENPRALPVYDINTGVYYSCIKEVADLYGINKDNLARKIRGERRNDTPFRYARD